MEIIIFKLRVSETKQQQGNNYVIYFCVGGGEVKLSLFKLQRLSLRLCGFVIILFNS